MVFIRQKSTGLLWHSCCHKLDQEKVRMASRLVSLKLLVDRFICVISLTTVLPMNVTMLGHSLVLVSALPE